MDTEVFLSLKNKWINKYGYNTNNENRRLGILDQQLQNFIHSHDKQAITGLQKTEHCSVILNLETEDCELSGPTNIQNHCPKTC